MIDISDANENISSLPPHPQNTPKASTGEGPEATCFCCGKAFKLGQKVFANEATANYLNAQVVMTLVCCSKRCANRSDELLNTLVGMAAQSFHVALHCNGSVSEFGERMHALHALIAPIFENGE